MSKQISNSALENPHEDRHFRARLMARLLVVFICVTLAGQRLAIAYGDHNGIVTATSIMITFPLLFALALIVIIKYVLYRKIGVRVFKYAKLLDLAFSLIFTAEWLLTLNAQLRRPVDKQDYSYSLISVVGFVSFAWRTLLQILISQYWQVKIIPPIAAYTYLLVFAVVHEPSQTFFILLSGLLQILYIILIFYFEHKINFTLLLGNMQQQQWLKLNEFILNNVPENIAIMDLNGNCSFINENFKKLINQRTSSDETKQFFTCIKDIKQLQQENENDSGSVIIEIPLLERCISSESKGNIHDETKSEAHANTFSLTELINFFGKFVSKGFVKEKSFYLFNGKFNCEENSEERSFEINLSFFNHLPDKYILLILRDTTQRDQLLALEGNIKYKDHLLASVSHELRTPLNGNINLLEAAIESNDVPSKIKENLLMPAVKSSKFLLYLINDILDMSQIKCQKLRLVFQQLSLKETIMNALQLLEHYAQKKHLKIQIDMDPNLPFTFCTDHARLSQIILNLVNNSIKFTQKGHIKLSAWPLRDTDQIVVSVEDPGIGMTKEDMSKIFREFTKIEGKDLEKLNPRGVGLGLKIANDLAEMLGPKGNKGIKVDSSINEGSVFSFVLENKETGLRSQETQEIRDVDGSLLVPDEFPGDTESSLEVKVSRLKSTSLTRCTRTDIPSITTLTLCSCAKVLVVDDDPFNIMAYEVILSSLRVKYECVYSGRSAIDKMLNKVRYPCSGNCSPYKIVFMDEEMPGMTGKETVREIIRLQEKNLLPEMKIIGCTAHHDGEEIEQFLKCGITEYVPKPISMNSIKRILDKYEA